MTVAELAEKLKRFPQDLDVHVMSDLHRELAHVASVDLIDKPFSDDPFVVIELASSGQADGDTLFEDSLLSEPTTLEIDRPPSRKHLKH
jgi:hypothetical protein